MTKIASVMTAAAILFGGASLSISAQAPHAIATPEEAQWGPAPPLLPPGAQIAVLSGNPGAAAPYSVRLKFPANYAIPAHSHPSDENVVITSGAVTFGMGDKLDKASATNKTLESGGYFLASANMNHYAFAGAQGATLVLYGQGPVEFKYVNPSDDPRNKGTK